MFYVYYKTESFDIYQSDNAQQPGSLKATDELHAKLIQSALKTAFSLGRKQIIKEVKEIFK